MLIKLKNFAIKKDELEQIILNCEKYFAHISVDGLHKETLCEHILLTQSYFFKLIEKHYLEPVILNLISGITDEKSLQDFIAEIFVRAVVAHDFGKVNPYFQNNKMDNPTEKLSHSLSSNHSLISSYIFILLGELISETKNFPMEFEPFIDFILFCFSYPILMHHKGALKTINETEKYATNLNDLKKFIKYFSVFNSRDFIDEINTYVFKNIESIIDFNDDKIKDNFALFALIKLLYSLLTASDYLATTHFMMSWEELFTDFGILNEDIKTKIIKNIENTKDYNKNLYKIIDKYKFEFPTQVNFSNLNKLRQNLAAEAILNVRKNIDKKLFYLEAPTGSGKTNVSMLTVAEFLKRDNKINKIFYVFPFTSLITQTFKALQETMGLNNEELVEVHYKSGLVVKNEDEENIYGRERKNIIDYLFLNYPVSVMSHVKFFEILKSNEKSNNYLLHRIANSIVIIDELQAYPPDEWDKIVYYIYNYAKYFNIRFILMSATLPKIDKLLSYENKAIALKEQFFVPLIKDKEKYFNNPNFSKRIEFDFSLLERENLKNIAKVDAFQKLWEKILIESSSYEKENNKVHTIVEFIFKKTASQFYEFAEEKNDFFSKIFILSGDILEARKKEVISYLKNSKHSNENILLITTQVIEAGVDIDMDIGFKDISLIDSDEQLAGRINRNCNKKDCKLFLFNLDNEAIIYSRDERYKIFCEKYLDKHCDILRLKNFDIIYNDVMEKINLLNQSPDFINLRDYIKEIKRLNFSEVNKNFQIIKNNFLEKSLFLPVEIPVFCNFNKNEKNFSDVELEFLKNNANLPDNISHIKGDIIWNLYCDTIENKNIDFFSSKFQQIVLKGLLSKFTINVLANRMESILCSGFAEEKYGFVYLHEPENIYSYETGFKTNIEFSTIW